MSKSAMHADLSRRIEKKNNKSTRTHPACKAGTRFYGNCEGGVCYRYSRYLRVKLFVKREGARERLLEGIRVREKDIE